MADGVADGRMRTMNNEEHRLNESREALRARRYLCHETEGALYVGSFRNNAPHKATARSQRLFPMRWNRGHDHDETKSQVSIPSGIHH